MLVRILFALASIFAFSQSAMSENFPVRPITVIVPFPPGGGLDFLIRTIQRNLASSLGQPFVIENKPGNLGNIGNAFVAKAHADGYTLLMTAVNIGVFPHMFADLTYDPLTAFAPIGEVAQTPGGCIVGSKSKINSFEELIKEAKANPGRIKFASEGTGAPSHLIVDLIAKLNDVKLTRVPYDFASLSIAAVMDGAVDFSCNGLVGTLPLIREGKVRAIAVTGAKRSVVLPNVPTVKEAGLGDIDENSRYILVAPAMTPKPIMERLSTALASALGDPKVQEIFVKQGFDLASASPAEVSALIQKQYDLWGPFIKNAHSKKE
jgi:tripartite-type tricarboxylate transporter receptor subunit TctC